MDRRPVTAARLAAVVLALGALAGCSHDDTPAPTAGVPTSGPATSTPGDAHGSQVTVARGDVDDTATLRVTGDASAITIGTDAGDGHLVEAVADGAGAGAPAASATGDTQVLALQGGSVTIRLAHDVTWAIDVSTGVDSLRGDLSGTGLSKLTLDGGARSIELTLPDPSRGAHPPAAGDGVAIDQTAGADHLELHLPSGVGARATVTSGAGAATMDGDTTQGLGAGKVVSTKGFSSGDPFYEVTVAGGLGDLVVDHH